MATTAEPAASPAPAAPIFGEDRPWLAVMLAAALIEMVHWVLCWSAGIAPAPLLGAYLGFALAALFLAFAARAATLPGQRIDNWPSALAAVSLVAVGASLFLPLKYAIPAEVPFWLDPALATAERGLFGADPWQLLDRWFGWATSPLDRFYGLWLPVQSVILFLVVLARPGPAKSRALISYSLAWLVLGVVAAAAFSSAGPLFYDRVLGGTEFASLRPALEGRGAWMAIAESDAMWRSLASGRPDLIAGISAMPSLHVAISAWMVMAARSMAPRLASAAVVYTALIWIASVQLGWHYVADGLAGIAGMAAIWAVGGLVERRLDGPSLEPAEAAISVR